MRARLTRPLAALPLTAAALLLSQVASADDPNEGVDTWDMTVDQLRDIGLGQYRGDPVPVPAHYPRNNLPLDVGSAPQHGGGSAGTIFVNFDGANLSSGFDDSINNVTQIGQLAGSFAAYGEGSKREAVMQAVRADWAEFNVAITETRPASGDYTMNMTGPTNPFGGGVLGIAPLDCNDSQTHNNITYAFHSENDGFSAAVTATTIGQEVAHSYGLEHVDEPGDIMNPYNAGGDAAFTDQCIQIVQSVSCGSQHSAQCGSSTSQNSYQELLALFGPSTPDTALPTVAIVDPVDGQEFAIGSDFTISVEAADDVGVQEIVLFNNGEQVQTDTDEPWGWDVTNVPEGDYEFYVEATDLAGNQAQSNVVTVVITADPDPMAGDDGGDDDGGDGGGEDGGGEGGGEDDGGDAGDGGDGGGDPDGALPGIYGQDSSGQPQSCACTTRGVGHGGSFAFLLLGLLGLGAVRRRRD
ncbi:MAG: Ig-like domain-containing protein [Myxococcota bacterium]